MVMTTGSDFTRWLLANVEESSYYDANVLMSLKQQPSVRLVLPGPLQ
jgi:hypothetical protein